MGMVMQINTFNVILKTIFRLANVNLMLPHDDAWFYFYFLVLLFDTISVAGADV